MRLALPVVLTLAAAALGAGCYDTPRPSCAFLCGTDQACPGGYTCAADGWCKRDDLPATFTCDTAGPDAATVDGPAPDAPDVDAPDVDAAVDGPDVDAGTDAPTDAPVDAAPAALEIITTNPVAFGTVIDTHTATRTVMVRNGGGTDTSALTVSVTGTGFTRVTGASDTCTGQTLTAAGMCSFDVRFAPGVGAFTGVAGVSATTGGSASINLTGTGAPALTASPSPAAFGSVAVSSTSDLPVVFTNNGTGPTATLTTAHTGDAQFSITTDTCDGASVAATMSCTVTVRFAPTAAGAVTGGLDVTGSPGGPVHVDLTGTGM